MLKTFISLFRIRHLTKILLVTFTIGSVIVMPVQASSLKGDTKKCGISNLGVGVVGKFKNLFKKNREHHDNSSLSLVTPSEKKDTNPSTAIPANNLLDTVGNQGFSDKIAQKSGSELGLQSNLLNPASPSTNFQIPTQQEEGLSNYKTSRQQSAKTVYSNDLENWNVKQGVSERSVHEVREYANTLQFCETNPSKQKSIPNKKTLVISRLEDAKVQYNEDHDKSLHTKMLLKIQGHVGPTLEGFHDDYLQSQDCITDLVQSIDDNKGSKKLKKERHISKENVEKIAASMSKKYEEWHKKRGDNQQSATTSVTETPTNLPMSMNYMLIEASDTKHSRKRRDLSNSDSDVDLDSEDKFAVPSQEQQPTFSSSGSEDKSLDKSKLVDENSSSEFEGQTNPNSEQTISDDPAVTNDNNNDMLISQGQDILHKQEKQITTAVQNLDSVAKVMSTLGIEGSALQSRLHQLNFTALGAGDEDNIIPKNVWVSGTIGIANNGKDLLSRYTGRTSAATIGGDLELPNGSIIGGAYNYFLSNFKYKNRTDKVAAHTHVISIYGQTNLSEELILQGFLSRAFGNVSAKLSMQNQQAKAKFANSSYSSKIVVAYKSKIGKALLIPHIGFKYGGQNIAGYDTKFETQSLSVAATNSRRCSGLIGFEAIMPMKISDTTQVIPGLHIEAEKFLHNKQQKLIMQIVSGPYNSREEISLLEKPAKYSYKIGETITIKRGSTEIMAVYDYLASNNKYSSHQGSLKIKLSF